MSFMNTGCQCEGCLDCRTERLMEARRRWKNGERLIQFINPKDFDDLNAPFVINGFEVNVAGYPFQMHQILADLFEFLEIEKVEVEFK